LLDMKILFISKLKLENMAIRKIGVYVFLGDWFIHLFLIIKIGIFLDSSLSEYKLASYFYSA
jgi:hypothetical protein